MNDIPTINVHVVMALYHLKEALANIELATAALAHVNQQGATLPAPLEPIDPPDAFSAQDIAGIIAERQGSCTCSAREMLTAGLNPLCPVHGDTRIAERNKDGRHPLDIQP